MKKIIFLLVIPLFLGTAVKGFADDIKGYMIPEYYTNLSSEEGTGHDGQTGFWLRRIYFGYNTTLSDKLSARVRLEMNSPAFSEGTMDPYIKNAHIKYQFSKSTALIAGIMEPPSFNKVEKFWGYRFIEKTAPDLFKLASSRDFGIALDGKSNGLVYTFMLGNYGSNKGEDNKGKGVYGRLGYESKTAYVEGNAHFAADGAKDIIYLNAFGGFKGGWGRVGVGYTHKSEKKEGSDRKNTGVISGFCALKLGKSTEFFTRYDYFTDVSFKNISGYLPVLAADYEARLLMAGLNFKAHKMVQLSPNIKYVFYSGDDHPKADFWINLTAKISFKTKIGGK